MKDWQPASIRGAFPVGGRLFLCWRELAATHPTEGRCPVGLALRPERCV